MNVQQLEILFIVLRSFHRILWNYLGPNTTIHKQEILQGIHKPDKMVRYMHVQIMRWALEIQMLI